MNDPWKHRSMGMRCKTCMWFVPKAPTPDFGRCRRHAPTMNGYPAVYDNDWCGDHKLNEIAVDAAKGETTLADIEKQEREYPKSP